MIRKLRPRRRELGVGLAALIGAHFELDERWEVAEAAVRYLEWIDAGCPV